MQRIKRRFAAQHYKNMLTLVQVFTGTSHPVELSVVEHFHDDFWPSSAAHDYARILADVNNQFKKVSALYTIIKSPDVPTQSSVCYVDDNVTRHQVYL